MPTITPGGVGRGRTVTLTVDGVPSDARRPPSISARNPFTGSTTDVVVTGVQEASPTEWRVTVRVEAGAPYLRIQLWAAAVTGTDLYLGDIGIVPDWALNAPPIALAPAHGYPGQRLTIHILNVPAQVNRLSAAYFENPAPGSWMSSSIRHLTLPTKVGQVWEFEAEISGSAPLGRQWLVVSGGDGPEGSTTIDYEYNDLNQLLKMTSGSGQTTFEYDLDGNMIRRNRPDGTNAIYEWDVADRLVRADVDGDGTIDFSAEYDYRSRRESTNEAGEKRRYHYFEGDCVQEFSAQGLDVEFVHGPGLGGGIGGILYSDARPGGGVEETFTYNSVGHTVALTDRSGNVSVAYAYAPFGEHRVLTGNSRNDRLANTRQHSKTLRLDNHGYRYYDPLLGRYISQDPQGLKDGLNLYIYAHNNPINGFDPTGLGGYGIGEWLWDLVTDSSIRNASAEGFAEGAKGGGSILVNEYSGGLSDKFGITNSTQYQGAAYDAARVTASISKEALMAAGGAGVAGKAVSALNKIDKATETIGRAETVVQAGGAIANGDFVGAAKMAGKEALGAGLNRFAGFAKQRPIDFPLPISPGMKPRPGFDVSVQGHVYPHRGQVAVDPKSFTRSKSAKTSEERADHARSQYHQDAKRAGLTPKGGDTRVEWHEPPTASGKIGRTSRVQAVDEAVHDASLHEPGTGRGGSSQMADFLDEINAPVGRRPPKDPEFRRPIPPPRAPKPKKGAGS